jgi:hypothetical protein
MAVCRDCNQEMTDGVACTDPVYEINGAEYQRIPFGDPLDLHPNGDRCHDCNTPRGGLHHPGCDGETCPVPECIAASQQIGCLPQSISCGCEDDEGDEDEDRDNDRPAVDLTEIARRLSHAESKGDATAILASVPREMLPELAQILNDMEAGR